MDFAKKQTKNAPNRGKRLSHVTNYKQDGGIAVGLTSEEGFNEGERALNPFLFKSKKNGGGLMENFKFKNSKFREWLEGLSVINDLLEKQKKELKYIVDETDSIPALEKMEEQLEEKTKAFLWTLEAFENVIGYQIAKLEIEEDEE